MPLSWLPAVPTGDRYGRTNPAWLAIHSHSAMTGFGEFPHGKADVSGKDRILLRKCGSAHRIRDLPVGFAPDGSCSIPLRCIYPVTAPTYRS